MSVSTQFLHTIQPVSEDRPAEAVAREILVLIRSEHFQYSKTCGTGSRDPV